MVADAGCGCAKKSERPTVYFPEFWGRLTRENWLLFEFYSICVPIEGRSVPPAMVLDWCYPTIRQHTICLSMQALRDVGLIDYPTHSGGRRSPVVTLLARAGTVPESLEPLQRQEKNRAGAQKRLCLKCREPFDSEGSHHRVCDTCKQKPAWRSGADLVIAGGGI